MEKLEKILVAHDFSENSVYAFSYAFTMAKQLNVRLIVLHVVHEAIDLRGFYFPHISFDVLDKDAAERAKEMMEGFCERTFTDFKNFESAVVIGIPHVEILKKAEQEKVSMIVMGTQGLTGVAHMLFGSTAERVVRNTKLPVLVVPLP
jgi:nucleotide-binding universal stress UspA family protein